MRRLLTLAATAVALALPGTAYAVPVSPVPMPSATFDGPVRTAVYWGHVIYVAGDFSSATVNGIKFSRGRLAALDARNGALLSWKPTANALVTSIAVDATGVYIAGDFTSVNGVKRDSLAKLDPGTGALRTTFSHTISGAAKAIATGHGRVYLGGSLTRVDGYTRNRVAAFDALTGALDQSWAPVADDSVLAILPTADSVFLGGRFGSVNGASSTQKLAAVTPDSGRVLTSFASKVFAMIHDLALAGGVLYAGIDGSGGRAMAIDAATGDAKWTITTDGDVQAIAVLEDVVYLGGHFDNVCKSTNVGNKGVCLDGSTRRIKLAAVDLNGALLPWTANGNGSVGVHTLIADDAHGQLSAGGEFSVINGVEQRRFALFNLPL
ncbi:hypothetical protein Rhe02_79150 [Rhizocola hellebori]|uniref:Pyrrolo-quinoline quinone repeat domain-containing protein n=1 Tax=Rhizocola hellebori TaxID=1392758 RepID=A0A8J3QI78_9ACTN|nr:PQQ-binding-like beta-propeller repeat protein [Rhizocola hellebori]GIH09848.1 hypothetical protein Rhe02_79150 [Rhizocola hellebori]